MGPPFYSSINDCSLCLEALWLRDLAGLMSKVQSSLAAPFQFSCARELFHHCESLHTDGIIWQWHICLLIHFFLLMALQVHEDEKQVWRALKHIFTSLLPVDRFTVTPISVGVRELDVFIMAGPYMTGVTELKTDAGGNSYGQVQAYYLNRVHDPMDPAVASKFQAHYSPILSLEMNAASLRVCGLCYHSNQVLPY